MALSIDSTDSTPCLTNGSISSCEDIEVGYSSQEDDTSNHAKDQLIVPKCIAFGRYTRRLSQCTNLPTRRFSRPEKSTEIASTEEENRQQESINRQFLKQECVTVAAPKRRMHGIIFVLLAISITYFTHHTRVQSLHQQVNVLHQARRHLEESHTQLSQELHKASFNLAQYKNTHEKMKKVNQDMSAHMRRLMEEGNKENLSELAMRAERAEGRLQSVVDTIRNASAEQVLEKYGPGPHQVELLVKLPRSKTTETIKLDLASIDTKYGMPHAVHTFLEQVQAKAWDGAAFSFHAGHVLLAVPSITPDGSSIAEKHAPTILFPEYNNAYPHEKYTVAFPGRPGTGKDFYINVRPNIIDHAPRIKDGKFVEGEPCFARIVDENSRRIIDEMDNIPLNSNGSLRERVIIQKARIVSLEESIA